MITVYHSAAPVTTFLLVNTYTGSCCIWLKFLDFYYYRQHQHISRACRRLHRHIRRICTTLSGTFLMNTCNDNHTEICYNSYNCPMCELLADLAQLRAEYGTLEKEFEDYEYDLNQHWNENLKFRSILQSIAPEHLL